MQAKRIIGVLALSVAVAVSLSVSATAAVTRLPGPGVAIVAPYGAGPALRSDGDVRYSVRADGLHLGQASVVLFRLSDGTALWSSSATVTPYRSLSGGWVEIQTGVVDCAGGANTAPNAYFRVQDGVSGRWSNRQYVTTGCVAF